MRFRKYSIAHNAEIKVTMPIINSSHATEHWGQYWDK